MPERRRRAVIDGPNVDLSSWPLGVTASYLLLSSRLKQQPKWMTLSGTSQCYNHIIPKLIIQTRNNKKCAALQRYLYLYSPSLSLDIKRKHHSRTYFLLVFSSFFFFSLFLHFLKMKSSYNRKHSLERLEYYYQVINTTVLSKQNAASGLIPASVAITVSCFFPFYKRALRADGAWHRHMVITRMPGLGKHNDQKEREIWHVDLTSCYHPEITSIPSTVCSVLPWLIEE